MNDFKNNICSTPGQIVGSIYCVLHIMNMSLYHMLLSNYKPKAFHFINFELGIKNVKLTYKCAN